MYINMFIFQKMKLNEINMVHVHVDLNEDVTPRNRFNTNSASMTTDCWEVNLELYVCCL